MQLLKSSFSILIVLILFSACSKTDTNPGAIPYDCEFVQNDGDRDGIIDEDERAKMEECAANVFNSKEEIENNLIGEWELIGHGEGWIPTTSKPCGYITISEKELTFEYHDANIDTTYQLEWIIEEVQFSRGSYFKLNIISGNPIGLQVSRFCKKYMYSDATPSDGNMYLFEKVK